MVRKRQTGREFRFFGFRVCRLRRIPFGKSLRVDPATLAASLGMTQSLLKRKFLATQLCHRRRDGGNRTSYVAAALTLTLSLDRERDRKVDTEAESKNSQTRYRTVTSSGRESPGSDRRSCSACSCG